MKSDENLIVPASRDPQEPEKSTIKEYLKHNGLSLKWLAAQLGLSEGTVKNWFYSSTKISDTNLFKINEIIKDHANGLINSSFWDKMNCAIFPESKEECDRWEKASQMEFSDSVEEWARETLNEWATRVILPDDANAEKHIWIHPLAENSLLLWRSAFFADTGFMRTYGNLKIDPSSIIEKILNQKAQEIIAQEKEKNNSFSLKNVELGQYDGISENEANNRMQAGEYIYYFTQANAYLWLVVCGMKKENVNVWANEVLDKKAEEAIFNKIKSSMKPEDEIPF